MHRRRFLTRLAAASAGLPALAAIQSETDAFASTLGALELGSITAADMAVLREQYSLSPDVKYLNHASIGTIPKPVQVAHRGFLEACETNPWLYMWGGAWWEPLAAVREAAAQVMGCDAASVAIPHNTTETFNVLAHGLPLGTGDEVLFGSLNHTGASKPFEHMAEARGFSVRRFDFPALETVGMSEQDVVDLYSEQIRDETRLLVLPHIDNTVGLRHPVRAIAEAARARGVDWIAVDGAQTVGMVEVDVTALGVDVFATSAHKWLQSPKGLGLTYYSPEIRGVVRPMTATWGQRTFKDAAVFEDYGTRNLPEVLALGAAMDFQSELDPSERRARLISLQNHTKDLADANPKTTWRSPANWELGSSLYAIEIDRVVSADLAKSLFESHGFVFRPFEVDGAQTIRVSPNVFTAESELENLFDLL